MARQTEGGKLFQLSLRLESLVIFRNLLSDPVIRPLRRLLQLQLVPPGEEGLLKIARRWGKVCAALYPETSDLSRYVADRVLEDDNFYVRAVASRREIPIAWQSQLERELEILRELSQLRAAALQDALVPPQAQDDAGDFLPLWETSPLPLAAEYAKKLSTLPKTGYGIFAKYRAFSLRRGRVTPIKHPDPKKLSQLFGYEDVREKILDNTTAFLEGQGGSNLLLYGDAGTGKSSTIKAVAGEYAEKGLRLIEIKKDQLSSIPHLLEELADNPLRFILFIDDLSFSKNDDGFSALKGILEGSTAVGTGNTLIYATSNRRHLVQETARERKGDDIHLHDTLQETSSLSARFGLIITFQQPSKEEFLMIVDRLVAEANLSPKRSQEELHQQAERFALRANGRTPRAAQQFVQQLKATSFA